VFSFGACPLREYQASVVGENGRISQRIDFLARTTRPQETASGFAVGNAIELWQNDRMIAKFSPSA
jgi:hypothetical protein